jgi:hypothetical protein
MRMIADPLFLTLFLVLCLSEFADCSYVIFTPAQPVSAPCLQMSLNRKKRRWRMHPRLGELGARPCSVNDVPFREDAFDGFLDGWFYQTAAMPETTPEVHFPRKPKRQ